MSLHKFAEQVAANGRGDDSLLVHMTPDEVRKLQQFAEANGTTLTINPDTGLPEAGMLSDLFKAIAPIALGAFLGPAGFGLSSMMAGVATGGITALATGSLSRGLMAGLGAYGGAGLGESLMGAGGNALVAGGAPVGAENLVGGVSSSGATAGSAVSVPPIEQINPSNFNLAKPDVLSAGAKAAAANPMAFAKQNLGNLAYAAAPIAAGLMVPTTTKMPEPRDSGFIRQMAFNINPDTGKPDPLYGMREMTPVKTSDFKNKTFQGQRDQFYQQNPNPYELGVGSLNQPPRMAGGGIVALAGGGDVVRMAAGTPPAMLSDEALYQKTGSWEAAAAARDAQNNALNAFNWQQQADARDQAARASNIMADADRLKAATNQNAAAPVDYNALATNYVNTAAANPNITTADFISGANAANIGLTQPLATALDKSGLSLGSQYALTHANIGDAGNVEETYGGLKGLSSNINYTLGAYNADAANKGKTGLQKQADALAALDKYGLNEADVKRATGKTIAELFPSTITKPVEVVPGGTQLPGATVYDNGAYGNYGSGPATGVDYRGNTVSIATPGDIITNTDGTRTVVPNIPGRPYGGFTGSEQVKSRYTAGGGSLGYTAPIPKDPEASFNKMTDDSLDAYNFLMGKGKNLTQRTATADRPVMRRYDEAVLGRKILRPSVKTTTTKTGTSTGTIGSPQSYFDEKAYLAANPDVAEEIRTGKSVTGQPTQFKSGYDHYVMYGKAGGRPFTGDYEGYTTALALANAAGAGGGGDGPSGPSGGNNSGTVSGFTPAPVNDSIPVSDMSTMSPAAAAAAAASAADGAAAAAASASGNAPGSDGSPGSGAKNGGMIGYAMGGGLGSLGSYSDGGRLLRGPGDGVSDSIPATIGRKQQPARLADGEFVIPARIVSELGNGSTDAGAKKLYAMMDRVQRARGKTTGKNKVAANSRADKYLPA